MTRRRTLLLLSLALVAGIAAFLLLRTPADSLLDATRKRIAALKPAVEEQRAAAERATLDYKPTVGGKLADLSVPADALLRQLPGVVQVDTLVTSAKPRHRLVHLRDWHLVPRHLFADDARQAYGRELTGAEVDALHEEHLLHVELVQLEHQATLRCLAKHHGVRQVLSEGMVEDENIFYQLKASELHATGRILRGQLDEARGLLRDAKPGSDRHARAEAIEREALALVARHRLDLVKLGAAAPVLAAGELADVLPLDDAELLARTYPLPGRVVEAAALRAREDFQVKAALASGPVAVLVLGGGHDLSDSVRRVGGGAVEYLRVTTRGYVEADRAR